MDETIIINISLLVILAISIRGYIGLFQRYDTIFVLLYIIFLSPVALIHALLLGLFGSSRERREVDQLEKEALNEIAKENFKNDLRKQ